MNRKRKIFYILAAIFSVIAALSFLRGLLMKPDDLGFFGNFGLILMLMVVIPVSSLFLGLIALIVGFLSEKLSSDPAKSAQRKSLLLMICGVGMVLAGYFHLSFYTLLGLWAVDDIGDYLFYVVGGLLIIFGALKYIRRNQITTQTSHSL